MVRIENLYRALQGHPVLQGVSLAIERGQVLALIGPSGGGKSVLLKHVVGLMRPDAGRVYVDGQDVHCLSRRKLNALHGRFGFLFQNGALFDSMTVFENVAFPLQNRYKLADSEVEKRVRVELDQVGLDGHGHKYPDELSGGMAKRVALARALVTSPEVMLFDEPTTGLDPIIVESIHKLIKSSHERMRFTGIIVTHEIPSIFPLVDKVAMLYEGRIRFVGTARETMTTDDEVVRAFVDSAMRMAREGVPEPGAATDHAAE